MKLEKRIKALEKRVISNPVVLIFQDGSTREIRGKKYFLLDLFAASGKPSTLTPVQAAQLESIRKSVGAREPGGGRMTELIRCAANISLESTLDDPEDGDLSSESLPYKTLDLASEENPTNPTS